jgi:hypothetical protein
MSQPTPRIDLKDYFRTKLHLACMQRVPPAVIDSWIQGNDVAEEHDTELAEAAKRMSIPPYTPPPSESQTRGQRYGFGENERRKIIEAIPSMPPALVDAWLRNEELDPQHMEAIGQVADLIADVRAKAEKLADATTEPAPAPIELEPDRQAGVVTFGQLDIPSDEDVEEEPDQEVSDER